MKLRTRLISVALAVVMVTAALPLLAVAEPPPWAPAHGWRRKHDPSYVGYHGRRWPDDYGVLHGSCNRAQVGAVLGGAVGGVAGSTIGKGETRAVAIVLGTVVGAVVGYEVGRQMDERDRACFGHSLELTKTEQTVRWTNPQAGIAYTLTPLRIVEIGGRPCRDYTLVTTYAGRDRSTSGRACRADDGVWRFA
jgi:surface antigen